MTWEDIGYLCMLRQGDRLAYSVPSGKLDEYVEKGYIERLKNGKVRMTPRGGSLMTLIETPGLTPEVEALRDAAVKLYRERDKETGVLREVEKRLCWFVSTTGFKGGPIMDAIREHLDTRGDYVMRLDNLIWKAGNVFQARMSLSESVLFDMIARRFGLNADKYLRENRDRTMSWLFAVAGLPDPPARMDASMTLTGDVKGDKEAIARIKRILGERVRRRD